MKLTDEQLAAILQRENGRIGLEVRDVNGVSYWITDVSANDRLRVLAQDGQAYWFDSERKTVTPVNKKWKLIGSGT